MSIHENAVNKLEKINEEDLSLINKNIVRCGLPSLKKNDYKLPNLHR